MQSTLITSAKASVILAIVGIVGEVVLGSAEPTRTATAFDRGHAEGVAFTTIVIHVIGIVAAIIALRAVKKLKLAKMNQYVALAALVLNVVALVYAVNTLSHS